MKAGRNLECSPIVAGDSLPRRSRESLPIRNPADETVLGSLVCASLADVREALAAAESVRRLWRQCPALERGAILERAASLMRTRIKENAELLTLEQGKTLAESEIEWERAIETFEWHGREAEGLNATTVLQTSRGERNVAPEPMGVAAAFTPWNYPAVIMAAEHLIRHVLELGGHSPVVIGADADIPSAATAVAAYKYDCAGQSCNAPSRIFIERAVYKDFVAVFVEISRSIKIAEGWLPDVNMGPMANARRLVAMDNLVSDAKARGGKIICGGARLGRPGYFFPPTVLLDLPENSKIFVDEPFGPVLPITSVDSIGEGVMKANENSYGLASYVFSGDSKVAVEVAAQLEAGSVGVNQMKGVPPDAAVSGTKDSGYGYEGGIAGVQAFQNRKLVSALTNL